jgi:hypothetical protein
MLSLGIDEGCMTNGYLQETIVELRNVENGPLKHVATGCDGCCLPKELDGNT